MSQLRYRGVNYDNAHHDQLPSSPAEHIYRGRHYQAPLHHEAAAVDPSQTFHYRGQDYHHEAAEAVR